MSELQKAITTIVAIIAVSSLLGYIGLKLGRKETPNQTIQEPQPAPQEQPKPKPSVQEIVVWNDFATATLQDDGTGHKRQVIYGIKQSSEGNVVTWKLGEVVE